jgi:uncharacterized RDD family membrane protein YckC
MTISTVERAWRRAGFWRRVLAFVIDMAVVLIPLQVVVAVLFAQTNGAVQGSYGLVFNSCQKLSQLPEGLQPVLKLDFNSIVECRSSFFGFETARTVTVSKVNQTGSSATAVFETHALGADGRPRKAVDTGWIALFLFFGYLVLFECRSGAAVGKRATGVRVIESARPDSIGIPARKAIGRYIAMWVGAVPAAAVMLVALGSSAPAELATNNAFWTAFAVAGIIELAWFIWIIVSISRKRDPIYDRIAGTITIRTS